MTYSVHDEPDFERVYDEDEMIPVRRGDLRALLDLATGSMDFGSGFWDEEQVEIARKIAGTLGIDQILVTPSNFTCQYRGHHDWFWTTWHGGQWSCYGCRHTSVSDPEDLTAKQLADKLRTIAVKEAHDAEERARLETHRKYTEWDEAWKKSMGYRVPFQKYIEHIERNK